MADWHERLAQAMEQKGWSAVELGRRTNLPEQSIYKYLQGKVRTPRGTVPAQLANALGVSVVWLMHGAVESAENSLAIIRVPLVRLSNWDGSEGDLQTRIRDAAEFVPTHDDPPLSDQTIAWRVDDDAVSRAPIGSVVIIDRERPPEPGKYVLAYSATLKRAVVRRWRATDYSGAGQLVADNADYPPLPMGAAGDGYIVGRVVLVISAV